VPSQVHEGQSVTCKESTRLYKDDKKSFIALPPVNYVQTDRNLLNKFLIKTLDLSVREKCKNASQD
jgi:hypothetical protein